MVYFSKKLKEDLHTPWEHGYIGYKALKKQLSLITSLVKASSGTEFGADRLVDVKLVFQRHLDSEISKMLSFYKNISEDLLGHMTFLQQERRPIVLDVLNQRKTAINVKLCVLDQYIYKWREAGEHLSYLLSFVSLNMEALRKIVKKQDKMIGLLSPTDSDDLQSLIRIKHPSEEHEWTQASFLSPLLIEQLVAFQQHESLQAAQGEIRQRLAQLHKTRNKLCPPLLENPHYGDGSNPINFSPRPHRPTPFADRSLGFLDASPCGATASSYVATAQARMERAGSASSQVAAAQARMELARTGVKGSSTSSPQSAGTIRRWASFGSARSNISEFEPVLRDIANARTNARMNAELVTTFQSVIARQAGMFETAPEDDKATATSLGLWLNLFNVFMYMVNYNMIIPTIDAYCTHLGVDTSVGGALIGAADLTAIAVSLGYSVWTNHSFRQPLLFAAVICLTGNLLYTLAYDSSHGVILVAIGRLLTGAGAARALNRRYIADFVSKEKRTRASIGFVAASAGGMAMGPLIAVPLTRWMDPWGDSVHIFGCTINAITVGGWIMVLGWMVYLAIALQFFVEPLVHKATPPDERSDEDVCAPLLGTDDPSHSKHDTLIDTLDGYGTNESMHQVDAGDVLDDCAESLMPLPRRSSWSRFVCVLYDEHFLPTVTCILLLFLLKLLQQGTVSSVPVLAIDFYQWTPGRVGLFMAISSLVMLPLNFSVAAMTSYVSDRTLTGVSLAACAIGCIVMHTSGHIPVALSRYLFAFELLLTFTNVMEGVSMSLLSKVLHPALSKGTFNAGLLATQSGSIGRLVGNFSIAFFGGLASDTVGLANLMYASFAGMVIVGIAVYTAAFKSLQG